MSSKQQLDNRFTVESISIESFRGYNKPHSFTFKEPMTVFYGRNGNGKSSTLFAIEWCLFGNIEFLSSLEGRARDEVINQFNPQGIASVKINLKNGKEEVKLERTKENGKANTHFIMKTKDDRFEDQDAEEQFFRIFGLTLDDFIRSVYLHQEAIRALLTDKKETRDEALDRLFGLETIRNIVKAIPVKDVKDKIKKLNDKKDSFGRKVSGAIEHCSSEIAKFRKNALAEGISESDLNLDHAVKRANTLVDDLTSLVNDYSLPKTDVAKPLALEDFKTFETKVKKVLKELQQTNLDMDKMSKLSGKKVDLEGLITSLRKQETPLAELQKQIDTITSKEGDLKQIIVKKESNQRELNEENERRDSLDANSKLIHDALQVLRNMTKPTCPVCNNQIDMQKTISSLESQAENVVGQQIQQIEKKLSVLRERKEELENLKNSLVSLSDKLWGEKKTETDIINRLSEELATKKDKTELISVAEKRVDDYGREIDKLKTSSQDQIDRLQKIRDSLDLIMKIIDVLSKEAELGKLDKLNPDDSREVESIGKTIADLYGFEDKLTKIVNAAGKIQTELASEMISSSQKNIESYYTKLCMHQHYDKLKIDVKPHEIRGRVKNEYAIRAFSAKDGKETHVATRFSTGQMNCVALSVFFALTNALPVRLGFLVLDDPSQNLDSEHKEALADILSSLSRERQIFVSTQDDEFKDILQSKQKNAKFYQFSGWDVQGPKLN